MSVADHLRQRERYVERYGQTAQPAGTVAWEVDETEQEYVCHVTKCMYSTPTQLYLNTTLPSWPGDLSKAGLALDSALKARIAALFEVEKATVTQLPDYEVIFRRVRHYGYHMSIVARQAAELCLQESAKWPKTLANSEQHCKVMEPMLAVWPPISPAVTQAALVYELACLLAKQIHGGDLNWPDTAALIPPATAVLDKILGTVPPPKAKPNPRPRLPPHVSGPEAAAYTAEEQRQKGRNRALSYVMRLKKLLKRAVPLCLQSAPGWMEAVQQLQLAMAEVETAHPNPDLGSEEQQWLDRLMQETGALCAAAIADDPSWVDAATTVRNTVKEVEARFPTAPGPAPEPSACFAPAITVTPAAKKPRFH